MSERFLEPGRAWPLGATVTPAGVNFALFSANAERVELCLFSEDGRLERERQALPMRTGDIWHGFLTNAPAGLLYGYRVYGPYDPRAGHRFNHHKLLIDPYARALKGELIWTDAHYGFVRGHAREDLSFDTRDNAASMPKCMVTEPLSHRRDEERPHTPRANSLIYELHVKAFTRLWPGMDKRKRGRYAALGSRAVVRYLNELGVTAVELLPVHQFVDDHFLVERGLSNHWGYQTLNFFTPMSRYAIERPRREFREMVRALHRGGIEVLLDVVYNHSCEGNELGPTLSYRGIDNRSYYRLAENPRYYVNDAGTGNTLAIDRPPVMRLVLDSLRYWCEEMQVDGFRFDLASILGRERQGFDPGAAFFDAVSQDPTLASVKLIAEPWDLGPGGYQLGNYPQRWAEWNDQFRDTVRRFWLGESGHLADLSSRLLGSSKTYERRARAPSASINFVTAHDGFTLEDLVSYDRRHNEPNGEGNHDGHGSNHSFNHGVEGATSNPAVVGMRERQKRNLLATLMLAQGTPMLLAGDENGHTQRGNNNAYCQDNETTWINWRRAARDTSLRRFVARLVAFRQRHPVLRRPWYLHGRLHDPDTGLPDIVWLNAEAEPMSATDWHAADGQFLAMQLAGNALPPITQALADDTLLMLFNASPVTVLFPLDGSSLAPGPWQVEIDTDTADSNARAVHESITVTPKSVIVARCYTPSSESAPGTA